MFPVQKIDYPDHRAESKKAPMSADGKRALAACTALIPELRARRLEIEDGMRLPEDIVQRMADIGCWMAGAPEEVGGGGIDYPFHFRMMEELGRGTATAGWSVLVHLAAATLSCQLPLRGARQLFNTSRTVIAGTPGALGRAVRVEGGYRIVDGEWAWASNSRHASHFIGGFEVVADENTPAVGFPPPPGKPPPESRIAYYPKEDVQIVEGSWDTIGLRGTHSGRFRVKNGFVPEHMCFGRFDKNERLTSKGPHGIGGHAAVLVGATRQALEYFYALGQSKAPVAVGMTGGSLLARPVVQYRIAEAEAKLRAARSWFYEHIEDCWARWLEGETIGKPDHLVSQMANVYLARVCKDVMETIFELCGTSGVFRDSPLEQIYRDVSTGQAHMALQSKNYETYGSALSGQPTMIFDVF